jgi:hypothetical protein
MAKIRIEEEMAKRLLVSFILIGASLFFHRIFSSIHEEVLGAIIFISVFAIGVLYYFINLFRKKTVKEGEYLVSVFFVFFLTITMFAVIYSEPIEDSQNYFLEFGKKTDLSFGDAFYFSVTTITTLGYGDITPVGVFRYIVIIEVLIGIIYAGSIIYFISREFDSHK